MPENSNPSYQNDEIDLFELVEKLRKDKLWIIFFICFSTTIGGGYAFFSAPIYQAEVKISPPSSRHIAELNQLSRVTFTPDSDSISKITTATAYEYFLQTLESSSLRKKFYSIPDIEEFYNPESLPLSQIWDKYNDSVIVQKPNGNSLYTSLKISASDPDIAANFANRYVDLALEIAKTSLISDFEEERYQSKAQTLATIKSKQDTYVSQIQLELAKLREAKNIASELGFDRQTPHNRFASDNDNLMVDEIRRLYSQGTIAIAAEIKILKSRIKDESLIPDLIDLKQKLAFLNSITLDKTKIKSAIIDFEATTPLNPIKPKKVIIIALSIVLGLIIGVIFVLIRLAVENKRKA